MPFGNNDSLYTCKIWGSLQSPQRTDFGIQTVESAILFEKTPQQCMPMHISLDGSMTLKPMS